jgi:MFS family permease
MQQSPGYSMAGQVLVAQPNAEGKWPAIVQALRNPNFRLFWSGNFLSNIGTWMQNVAQGWLVLMLTNSAFWLGVVGFAGAIPFLIFMLFGGVIADRVDKRRLLLVHADGHDDAGLLLPALTYCTASRVWVVAVLAFLNGTAMAMNNPSYQAMVPKLVKREDLTNAIALNSAQFNMSRILGPTLGGYAMARSAWPATSSSTGLALSRCCWPWCASSFRAEKPSATRALRLSLGLRFPLCAPPFLRCMCS